MYVIFATLNSMFSTREKYAWLDFVKFISLEINYFKGICFFIRNIDTLLFQVAKISILILLFYLLYFLYIFLPVRQARQLLIDFLGKTEIKSTR